MRKCTSCGHKQEVGFMCRRCFGDTSADASGAKAEKLTRRDNEPVFSRLDMMRFARYLSDGKHSEADLKRIFHHWTQNRFNWIAG